MIRNKLKKNWCVVYDTVEASGLTLFALRFLYSSYIKIR